MNHLGFLCRFKAGDMNFDDIDDSGKYNQNKPHKTFFEAPNMTLFFVILKHVSGQAQVKLWIIMSLLFLKCALHILSWLFANP